MAEKMVVDSIYWLSNTEKPVFHVLWAPEALNDTPTENKKQPNFDKIFFVFSVSGSFLVSGGQKTQVIFEVVKKFSFLAFSASRGKKRPLNRKYKTTQFW